MGSLEVQMQIEPTGIVSELRFPLQRISSEKLMVAVYDQMRTWRFPPAETPVGLRYRLLFIPPGLEAKSITAWEEKLGSLIFPVEDSAYSGLTLSCVRSAGTLQDPERAVGRDGRG